MMMATEHSTSHLVSVYSSQHPYHAGTGSIAVVHMRALRLYRDPETLRVWPSVRALEPDCLGLNPSVARFFLGNLQQWFKPLTTSISLSIKMQRIIKVPTS